MLNPTKAAPSTGARCTSFRYFLIKIVWLPPESTRKSKGYDGYLDWRRVNSPLSKPTISGEEAQAARRRMS